ncbi:hypothetical protein SteCoe_7158 [Stentor coeruleus]|uniref:Uncharacterized protein n=1 Tax=Stentor coeruleus TaxID=5963 RepID=A0A1R2CN68_9CILI|nr:hypothetical protein SteCoe_7158 [Stentor coeruleus]
MLSYELYLQKLSPECCKVEYPLGNHSFVTVLEESEDQLKATISANLDHLILHWGLGIKKPKEWINPLPYPGIKFPSSTVKFDDKSAESPFVEITSSFSTISITFTKSSAPIQLNFVLKRENIWYNNNSMDYGIPLKLPEVPIFLKNADSQIRNLVTEIIDVEMSGGAWTLMHRFNMCNNLIKKFSSSQEGLSWIFIWMRYSALRILDWQRYHNTRPSELASSQKNLTFTIISILKTSSTTGLINTSNLVRGILSCMGKGGDNGQRIRDEILQIMHRGGIRHHKSERDNRTSNLPKENLYEQWHQKLHNNTTPDDIGICEALISYNEHNDINKYWEVLSKHGLTKERLASYDRPLTYTPFYAPQIISDLYGYLELLKQVHGSVDLSQGIQSCKGFLPGNISKALEDITINMKHWDKISQMERVTSVRKDLKIKMQNLGDQELREVVYLDIALESYIRQLVEEIIHLDLSLENLCKKLYLLLNNVSLGCSDEEFSACCDDYYKFLSIYSKTLESYDTSLIIKAATDRIQRLLLTYVDEYTKLLDTKGRFLGEQFHADQETIDLFTEELIRGSLFFAVSIVLKKINSKIRIISGLKAWQVISPVFPVIGKLTVVDSLHSVAYEKYPEAVVLCCLKVTGEEEIPEGATGVISSSELDTLAHVSVRARNNKVLLTICYDQDEFMKIQNLHGHNVKVTMSGLGVEVKETNEICQISQDIERREIQEPLELENIVMRMEEFMERRTGAKANNCGVLKRNLGVEFVVPRSGALPYGTFEYILDQEENSQVKSQIFSYLQELDHCPSASETLNSLRSIIQNLSIKDSDKHTIQNLLQSIGCTGSWDLAWKAIKSVWASKFNERVFLSTQKARINLSDVKMSVLCQEVISGDYAFVLHTKNPTNNNTDEIYGELVKGLGETLVGAYDGRSMAFVLSKTSGSYKIESFPNKSIFLQGGGFIFRSDSNSEDLPGFAGAGLFDSFIMDKTRECRARYAEDQIVVNCGYRNWLFGKLKELGIAVERVFGGVYQDIEGVVCGDKVFVVQSRPQV